MLFPQVRSDFMRPHASVGVLEYPLDDPRRFIVHDQLVVVVRGLAIPQRGIGTAVQSRLLARMDERILRELSRL